MNADEIIKEIKDRGLTAYQIAKELPATFKLTEVGINKILNGTSTRPQRRTLDILEAYLHKSLPNNSDSTVMEINTEYATEQIPTKAGHIVEEMSNGKYKLWTKRVPIKAFASYLSDFRNVSYYEELEDVPWTVDHNPRGRYMTFGSEGDSMNGGGIYDSMDGADLLCRELLKHHWRDGFRDSPRGWVIVHKDTILHKDITDFNPETGDIVCHSRSGLPNHPDFTINLNDVLEIWKVIKIAQ